MPKNMKEIRFRAWDIIQKVMCYGSEKPYMYLTPSERLIGIGCDLHHSMYHDTSRSFDKEIILMQYTGLKDRNGKEIFDSDYVWIEFWNGGDGYNEPEERDEFKGVVVWNKKSASFGLHTKICPGSVTRALPGPDFQARRHPVWPRPAH